MDSSSASAYPGDPAASGPTSGGGTTPTPRTITKKELVARIAEQTNQTKVIAKDIIQLFLDEIIRELGNGNRLEFREFGVFEIKERAARKAQNPRTLEKVNVPAKRVVKFKVGRLMKECVADEHEEGPTSAGPSQANPGRDRADPPGPGGRSDGGPSDGSVSHRGGGGRNGDDR